MILPTTRMGGFAGRTIVAAIALLAILSLAAIPVVRKDMEEQQRKEIIQTLAMVTMAKTAYAVDNELIDGHAVTLEQIIRPGNADPKDARWKNYLKERPAFPTDGSLNGDLKLNPIGELPAYVLKSGEEIKIEVGTTTDTTEAEIPE